MGLDDLVGLEQSEEKLLETVATRLQLEFDLHQKSWYFIKLEKTSTPRISKISWIKEFDRGHKLTDFFYDTKWMRACILTKFENDIYSVMSSGFYYIQVVEINRKFLNYEDAQERSYELEARKMIPREIIEEGFGSIGSALKKSAG